MNWNKCKQTLSREFGSFCKKNLCIRNLMFVLHSTTFYACFFFNFELAKSFYDQFIDRKHLYFSFRNRIWTRQSTVVTSLLYTWLYLHLHLCLELVNTYLLSFRHPHQLCDALWNSSLFSTNQSTNSLTTIIYNPLNYVTDKWHT